MKKWLARRMGVVPRLSFGMVSGSRTIAGALVCVFCVAAPSFAQSVADVARQERERQQQKPCVNRVYTNEDLSRPQILNAKDRACLEASREVQPGDAAPAATFSANAAVRPVQTDTPPFQPVVPPFHLESMIFPYESALPDFPLAEIAPYDREMKAARLAREAQLQKTVVVSAQPGRSRHHAAAPASGIAPSIPEFRLLEPANTSLPPAPFAPEPPSDAPRSRPAKIEIAPAVRIVVPVAETEAAPSTVRVDRGDSLWKIAERHLGDGRKWRRLAAANPHIASPNLIRAGDVLQLPAFFEISNLKPESASSGRPVEAPSVRDAPAIRVVLGDTLWALARTQFGRGSAWICIAQANQLPNPDLILPGQTLALPASCPLTN